MTLSAIVVTHNSAGVVGRCLRSLHSALSPLEIIVVDNASTDDTTELCARTPDVGLVANGENIGYGRACNRGAARATGSHLLFVNPDIEVTGVDRERLTADLKVQPFGLLSPQLRSGRHALPAGYRHRHWTADLIDRVAGPLRPRELPPLPRLPVRPATGWLSGALLIVAREEFQRVGGFDKRYFLYYEDRDLSRRYAATGLPLRSTSSLSARHLLAASANGPSSGLEVRDGWCYLGWIEYLCIWHGRATAERAVRAAEVLRGTLDRGLRALQAVGLLSERAERKRRQLQGTHRFITWQSSLAAGTAAPDYCPQARRITGRR